MQLTYRYRIKDKHAKRLNAQARVVNFVWNYCNETQMKAARDGRKWLSGYDLGKLVAGATKEGLDLHSHSAKRVCIQYDKSRRQHKKPWLRWRSRRSLGWVPFNTGHVAYRDGGFVFRGERYEVWLHRPLPDGARIGAGSFSLDTRGRWYINCPVEVCEGVCLPGSWRWTRRVGIDLGLKDLATLSTGEKVQVPKFYGRASNGSPGREVSCVGQALCAPPRSTRPRRSALPTRPPPIRPSRWDRARPVPSCRWSRTRSHRRRSGCQFPWPGTAAGDIADLFHREPQAADLDRLAGVASQPHLQIAGHVAAVEIEVAEIEDERNKSMVEIRTVANELFDDVGCARCFQCSAG